MACVNSCYTKIIHGGVVPPENRLYPLRLSYTIHEPFFFDIQSIRVCDRCAKDIIKHKHELNTGSQLSLSRCPAARFNCPHECIMMFLFWTRSRSGIGVLAI